MSIQVKFENDEAVNAIKDVHNDTSDITWCIVTHLNDNPNILTLQKTGKGGVEEMLASLSDSQVQYCLYRSTLRVDLSETVKFTFIYNLGEKVSFFKKGRLGTVKGDAIHYFEPFHVDFEISNPNELSVDIIEEKLKFAAGVGDAVRESTNALAASTPALSYGSSTTTTTTTSTTAIPAVAKLNKKKSSSAVTLTKSDEVQFDQSILDAIKKVRNDSDPTTWCVGTYKDNDITKPVELLATGTGDTNEMKNHFTPERICYSLIRVIDVYENINTVKFVFIYWLGSKVSVMKKAKISVHKGKVNEIFSTYHVDFMISSLNEISNEIVMRKVSQNSGSRSMVTRK